MLNGKQTWMWARYGLLLALIGIGVVFLLKMVAVPHVIFAATIPDINVRQQLETGVSPDIGNKLLGYLGGIIPTGSGLLGWIPVLLSGAVIFVVGAFALSFVKRNFTPTWRPVLVGMLGSLAVAAFLTWTGILQLAFISTLIALGLYYLILVLVANGLSKLGVKFLETPDVR